MRYPTLLVRLAFSLGALAGCALPAQTAGKAKAPAEPLGSTAFIWEKLAVRPTAVGQRRDVVNRPTATLARFQSHITTLNPGKESHGQHQHPLEEMIFLKEGQLEVTINDRVFPAGPGSVLFYASNDFHKVKNVGDTPATYVVINFGTAATATAPKERAADSAPKTALRSQVFEWTKLPAQPTKNGERRAIFAAPTVTCDKLSVHATTVKGGEAAHGAHRHGDEEVVLVKEGTIEVDMNGAKQRGGPGSLFFFASNDEHGLRNAGDTPLTYYVIRVVSAATPKTTAAAK